MNIKFKENVEISQDTFKISVQELSKFLEEFRNDLQEKLDFLITLETKILCENRNKNGMETDQQDNQENVLAAEKIIPYLEGKLRRFSFGNMGVSFSKTLKFAEK